MCIYNTVNFTEEQKQYYKVLERCDDEYDMLEKYIYSHTTFCKEHKKVLKNQRKKLKRVIENTRFFDEERARYRNYDYLKPYIEQLDKYFNTALF
jgi:hypothetical protein